MKEENLSTLGRGFKILEPQRSAAVKIFLNDLLNNRTKVTILSFESLEAALYPAEEKYLYFVSKKDGSHHFSTSFREHQNGVRG